MSSDLTPVPKGMCPAFYQFMGAGGQRSDSGEILMLKESPMTSNPTPDRTSEAAAAAARVRRVCAGEPHQTVYGVCLGDAMRFYTADWETMAAAYLAQSPTYAQLTADLAAARAEAKDLACFCALDNPCHADVLLELANAEPTP